MGMGLLTSAISKAEDKHKTVQDGQKRAGRQAAGRQLDRADGRTGWDKTGQGPIARAPYNTTFPYLAPGR